MKKKTLIIIIAVVLAVLLAAVALYFATNKPQKPDQNQSSEPKISSNAGSQQAVEGGKVELGKVETTADGEFAVEVKIADNVGFAGYDMEFMFDSKAFSFVDCESGLVTPLSATETETGKVAVIGVVTENGDMTENGSLFTLKFKANKDAAKGEYEIKANKAEFANWDEITVKPQIETGTIIVK